MRLRIFATASPRLSAVTALVVLLMGTVGSAQSSNLVARLNAIRDGDIAFTFATQPGVCGRGESISLRNSFFGSVSDMRGRDWERDCTPGPARVTIQRAGGVTTAVRIVVAPRRTGAVPAQDWGEVSTAAAARVLMHVAETSSGRPAQRAMLAAVLADSSPVIWPDLLRIARNAERPRSTRQEARVWLSRIAADYAFGPEPEGYEKKGDDEKSQAVFALSQLPDDQGVPDLISIARTHRDFEIRRKALFWLGQSDDDRVLTVLEEFLSRKR